MGKVKLPFAIMLLNIDSKTFIDGAKLFGQGKYNADLSCIIGVDFTRAFVERLWCMKHDNTLLAGKPCATVLNGLGPAALETANNALAKKLTESDRVNLLGQITLTGKIPCNTCGKGEECKTNALHKMRKIKNDPDLTVADFPYADFSENERVYKEISALASKFVSMAKTQ